MQRIEIERQKKILKRAKKTLNCILEAKRRIEYSNETIKMLHNDWYNTKKWHQSRIEILNRAIVRLESIYKKIISQL